MHLILLPPGLAVEILPILAAAVVRVATGIRSGVKSRDVGVKSDFIGVTEPLTECPICTLAERGFRLRTRRRRLIRGGVAGEAQVLPGLLVVAVEAALVTAGVERADRLSIDGTSAILQPARGKENMRFSSVIWGES